MWLCVSELILLLGVTAGTGYLWGHYNTKVVDPTPTISQAHKQYKDDAETIFSVFPDLAFHLDEEGRILSYRTSNEEQLYASPKEFLGKKPEDILPEPVKSLYRQEMEALKKGKDQAILKYQLTLPNGQKPHFESRIFRKSGDSGFINIIRDISDFKEAEKVAIRAQAKIEQQKGMNNLIATYHHELNNPLAVALGLTQVLAKEFPENSKLQKIDASLTKVKDVVRKIGALQGSQPENVKTASYHKDKSMVEIEKADKRILELKKNLKVLVVDDSQDMLALFLSQLHQDNFQQVNAALSLQEGLELLDNDNYDVVLCDMNLADDHSDLLANKIQSLKDVTPFILLSTLQSVSEKVLETYGAVAFLSKPLEVAQVEEVILNSLPEALKIFNTN